jgi:hypothetical protein
MSSKKERPLLPDDAQGRIEELWNSPRGISVTVDDKLDAFGSVDLSKKSVSVNPGKIADALGERHLETVVSQGVGNFALCPYDLKTAIMLEYLAYVHTGSMKKARFVRDAFGNIILKSYAHEHGDAVMKENVVDLISKGIESSSDAGKLALRFFEKQLNLEESTLVPQNSIDDAIEGDSSILRGLFLDRPYSLDSWKKVINRFADILLRHEKKSQSGSGGSGKDGKDGKDDTGGSKRGPSKDYGPGGGIEGELDVEYGNDRQAMESALRDLAREMGMKDFRSLTEGLGLGDYRYADLIFYRSRSERCRVHLPRVLVKSGELYPSTPAVWEACDDVISLDVQYSLGRHGIIIPGETTHKWAFEESVGFKLKHDNPDLLIALDSSGSMKNPSRGLSLAVLSAMAAKSSALARGSKVAVINFSSSYKVVDYTSDEDKLDHALTFYYGEGTEFPAGEVLRLVGSSQKKQHILMITDAELSDFKSALVDLKRAVKEYPATGSVFLIDNAAKSYKAAFERIGFSFFAVDKEDDLLDLVIEDIKSKYDG